MSDSIEYCKDCPANVGCHLARKCLELETEDVALDVPRLVREEIAKLQTGTLVIVGWHGSERHKHGYTVRNDLGVQDLYHRGDCVSVKNLLDGTHDVFLANDQVLTQPKP